MYKLILPVIILVSACGKTDYVLHETFQEKRVEVEVAQDFEGFYSFENNSQLELVAGSDNEIHVLRDAQVLNTVNPENDTLGTFPIVTESGVEINNGALFFSKDLNYRDGNDLEEDVSGDNIRGRRRTDFTIEKTEIGVRMTVQIYANRSNDNLNFVVATRVFNSK